MQLEALFQQPHALPAAPRIVDELVRSFDNPAIAIEDIARQLGADPVLSAKLLRLAAWRARIDENQLSNEEIIACYPNDVAEALGLPPSVLVDRMPPPAELSAGLEELVK